MKNMKKAKFSLILVSFLSFSVSPASAFSTHNATISRTFDKVEAAVGESITVTVSFTNEEAYDLRGFYHTEQIPEGLSVNTDRVKIGGTDISHLVVVESGSSGDVYPGSIPYRWILETPTDFPENNPISQSATVEIVYTVTSSQVGTFDFDEFSWVGYYETALDGERAAFGHSEDADKQTITFTEAPYPPVANFSGTPTTGTAPLEVSFTDSSTGEIESWSWSFGDGGTSTEQNLTYTYDDPGDYTVTLEVTGPGGSDTETKDNYITVTEQPAQYILTVTIVGQGNATLDPPGGTYDAGTVVKLTPVSDVGWAFNGWSDDLTGYSNPATIVINADKHITATFDLDNDADGISDAEEDGGPNAGDGNSDDVNDSDQPNVASFHTQDGTNYVTLVSAPGTLSSCRAVSPPSGCPTEITFPYGFIGFTVNDAGVPPDETTVTLYLPAGTNPSTYWKHGRTPANQTDHWYEFLYDGETGAEINENVTTLHFIDSKRGDDILMQDGMIVDQGGPGVSGSNGDASSSEGNNGCFISTAAY